MRSRLLVRAAGVLAVTVLAALSPTPPAAAAPAAETPPELVDVALSRAAVAVSGVNTASITVSVRLTDETGVIESRPTDSVPMPAVVLTNVTGAATAGAPAETTRDLSLTSGTATDGTWSTQILVPSTYDGRWEISAVYAQDTEYSTLTVDPREVGMRRSLTVDGSHQPTITMGFAPNPVVGNDPFVDIKGRVVDADTGAPFAGVRLTIGNHRTENCGYLGWGGSASATTDASGYYGFLNMPAGHGHYCVINTRPQMVSGIDQFRVTTALIRNGNHGVQPAIGATPERTPVRVGQSVAVFGNVSPPAAGATVYLQHYAGGQWPTVGQARVTTSSRYTLTATPMSAGNHRYRVYLPGPYPAYSRVVLIGAN